MPLKITPDKITVTPTGEVVISSPEVLDRVQAISKSFINASLTNGTTCNGSNLSCDNTGDCSQSSNTGSCNNSGRCFVSTFPGPV